MGRGAAVSRRRVPRRRALDCSPFQLHFLTCLRCALPAVPIPLFQFQVGCRSATFACHVCHTQHFLSIHDGDGSFVVHYQRYTQRYAPHEYDHGGEFPVITLGAARGFGPSDLDHAGLFSGPIVVYRAASASPRPTCGRSGTLPPAAAICAIAPGSWLSTDARDGTLITLLRTAAAATPSPSATSASRVRAAISARDVATRRRLLRSVYAT